MRQTAWGLAALAGLAAGVRLATALALGAVGGEAWAYEHGEIAANLIHGLGFSGPFLGGYGPTSQQAPFYPCLVAAAYSLFGVGTKASHAAVLGLQCLVGAATSVFTARLTWALFPPADGPDSHSGVRLRPARRWPQSLGWLAGLGAALYPPHVYMATHLQVAVWATAEVTLLLWLVCGARPHSGPGRSIGAGLVAGALVLTDPILILALPVAMLALALQTAPTRPDRVGPPLAWRPPLALVAVAGLVVSPWLVRNYCVHAEFVLVKSTFGYAFWQGNNPYSWGTDKIPKPNVERLRTNHDGSLASMDRALWEARHETLYIDDVLLAPDNYREFHGLSEPARSRLLLKRSLAWIRKSPESYLRLCVRRFRYFMYCDETNPKAAHPIYRASTLAWLAATAVGFVVLWREGQAWWPCAALFIAVALFHTLTIVSARFRMPVEPLTFPLAAAGLHSLLRAARLL